MLKKTVQLFIKALIIGTLINFGLQFVPVRPLPTDANASQHEQQPQQPDSTNHVLGLNQAGK